MVPIATLRYWAGVEDSSEDATLQSIFAGVAGLFERVTGRIVVSPPAVYEQVLDVPGVDSGGLSGIGRSQSQRIQLAEEPRRARTGTVTVTAGETTVTGSGTAFTSELSADPSSAVEIEREIILVSSITSDTELELATAHGDGASGASLSSSFVSLEVRNSMGSQWLELDPTDVELDGRTIVSGVSLLTPGERLLRARYILGYEEGELPDEWELSMLRAYRSVWTHSKRRTSSITVDGAIKVDWSAMGGDARSLHEEFQSFARPLGRTASGRWLEGSYPWAA